MLWRLALRNLDRNRLRSALAVLGILIGVLVISSVGIFGTSIKHATLTGFEGMTDTVVVTPNFQEGVQAFNSRDMQTLRRTGGVTRAIPVHSTRAVVNLGGLERGTLVYGLSPDALNELFDLRDGASPRRAGTVALGSHVTEETRGVGGDVSMEGRSFRISGVLEEAGFTLGINPNTAIFLEPSSFETTFGDSAIDTVILRVDGDAAAVADAVEKRMNRREERVRVTAGEELLESVSSLFDTISKVLLALAGISLLVAGVSILNVMLMSTVERTKEIGVMKAVGGGRSEILQIFLAEALLLGALGSAAGCAISLVVGYTTVSHLLGDPSVALSPESLGYVVVGGAFGLLSSVAAGAYPAWRASGLDPVEALRRE